MVGSVSRCCVCKVPLDKRRWCRHRKRGLAVLPTKFGISFTFKPMNQAGALVSIFLDGSVSVAHGGVEMGQGLHTKMCQVAASALKVPLKARSHAFQGLCDFK